MTEPLSCHPSAGRGPDAKRRKRRVASGYIDLTDWAPACAGVVNASEVPVPDTSGKASGRVANGFTLIEVMISLMIFGLLSAAGVALLAFSVRAQGATGAKLDDVSALNRVTASLSADLAQAVVRRTRNEAGDTLPAFTGEAGSTTTPMLRLVRAGWSNFDDARRAGEQKVEYRLADDTLQRIAYPMLDGAEALPPAALLTGVRNVALRYRTDGAWSDRWEPTPRAPLPQVMELRLTRTDGTEFRALFLVGTGYRPTVVPNAG